MSDSFRKPFVQDFGFETPDECECPGYPCEHVPVPRIATSLPYHGFTRPVTMEMAAALSEAGLWNVADIARKYAVDRPRWWHRFTTSPVSPDRAYQDSHAVRASSPTRVLIDGVPIEETPDRPGPLLRQREIGGSSPFPGRGFLHPEIVEETGVPGVSPGAPAGDNQ